MCFVKDDGNNAFKESCFLTATGFIGNFRGKTIVNVNNKLTLTKETLKKCVSLANDAHGRTEEGASPCASGAGKRFNQRFPKEKLI